MDMFSQKPPSFCSNSKDCTANIRDGKLQCHCGEDMEEFRWCWSKWKRNAPLQISNDHKDVIFHPLYSSGTAVVRGNIPFELNMHYYWEVKIISNLYGTDVMIGVGTQSTNVSIGNYGFRSLLGYDSYSWGYSYRGILQHDKMIRKYGPEFGQGSIVGVHLDMYRGTLEYHINRRPLGIAFTDLRKHELYPMVCSTAAQSAVRIICSLSQESTLQMKCLQILAKHPALYKKYMEIPGFRRLYKKKYFWIVPSKEEDEKKRLTDLEDQLMCPLSYGSFVKRKKNNCISIRWIPPNTSTNYEEDWDYSDEENMVYSTLYPSRNSIEESRSKKRRIDPETIVDFEESSDSS